MTEPLKPKIVVAQKVPRLAVRESSQGPTAMEAKFTCDSCRGETIVKIRWNATAQERSSKMKEALDLHRMICPVGLPEDMRTYRIHYPR